MSELVRLLLDLGRDADLAEAWARDPDEVLQDYELDEEVIEALKAGDVDALKAASGLDDVRLTNTTVKAY
jgi:Trk K+ transport system NAD-binding subunit